MIQRYELTSGGKLGGDLYFVEDNDGKYVLFAAHEAEVKRINEQWENFGTIEVMIRNVNINSAVNERERRILDLEQKLIVAVNALKDISTCTCDDYSTGKTESTLEAKTASEALKQIGEVK